MKCHSWYPGKELTAEGLVAWEKWLLSGGWISPDHADGIALFDWSGSLQPVAEEGRLTVRLTGPAAGVTPGGLPVVLQAGESMVGALALGPRDRADFDLVVEVNPPDAGPEHEDKFRLLVLECPEGAAEPRDDRWLYLGRYRWAGGTLTLLRPPPVCWLAALRPYDQRWREWVRPISTLMEGLRERASGPGDVARLYFEWPYLSVPQLARRLTMVGWLLRRWPDECTPFDGLAACLLTLDDISGWDLPRVLAEQFERTGSAAAERRVPSPRDVIFVWSPPRSLEVRLAAAKPGEALELRLPRELDPPDRLKLTAGRGGASRDVRGVDRGAFKAYGLGNGLAQTVLHLSPLSRPAEGCGEPELWVVSGTEASS
jgi:hypothetical protein